MSNKINYEENFIKMEEELKLFKKSFLGFYYWKLIRFNLLLILKYKISSSTIKTSLLKKSILTSLRRTRFKKNTKVLIFTPGVYQTENNQKIRKYFNSEFISKICKDYGNEVQVVSRSTVRLNKNEIIDNSQSLFNLFKIATLKYSMLLNNETKKNLNEIKKIIKDSMGQSINLVALLKSTLAYQKVMYNYYKKKLINSSVEKIYILNSSGKEGLIRAANDLQIKIIERQHGGIPKNDLGYHFPNLKKAPYFPDEILVFGEFWASHASIPLPKNKIKIEKDYYLFSQLDKFKNNIQTNNVLFISQWTLSEEIFNFIISASEKDKKRTYFLKPHPSDKKIYVIPKHINNLIVTRENIYSLFSKNKNIVGVYSTSTLESLLFNCNLFLLDMSGVENFQFIIEKLSIPICKTPLDLIFKIENIKKKTKEANEFLRLLFFH